VKDLHFIRRNQINDERWNKLIGQSLFSLPYAYTWYLDEVAENWDALVWKDYEVLMPLVWLRKFGFKCIYQPYYCQQLGIFAAKEIPAAAMKNFIEQTLRKFPYIDINLNPSAAIVKDYFKFKPKKNLLLPLNKTYGELVKSYSVNHRRNIAKAEKADLIFSANTDIHSFQKFYINSVKSDKDYLKPKHEKIFKNLSNILTQKSAARIFSAADKNGNLLACALVVYHQQRIINLINCNSPQGRACGASHFLFDRIIRQSIENQLIMDFEGSSIPGVAAFYMGFGALEEIFFNYRPTIISNISQRFG
jgi:hypothetical protein